MTPREALVNLNLLEGIGPIQIRQLLEFLGEATKVLQAPHTALKRVKGFGDDLASTIRKWETTTDLAGQLKRVEEFGARLVFRRTMTIPSCYGKSTILPSCFTRRAAFCPRIATASRW